MPGILRRNVLCVSICGSLLGVNAAAIAQAQAPPPPDRPAEAPAQAPARPAADAARWIENIEFVHDVVYATITSDNGEERELLFDAAFPKQGGDQPLPAIIYIHGGGWSGGAREAGLPFTIAFANGGYFACTISYRLSGEAKYPAAVHDCKAAVRFLRANAAELGIDPDRIGVWGHSAGGHLSAMLGLTGDDAALEGEVGTTGVSSKVNCFVSVCGPAQLAGFDYNNIVANFLGGATEEERAPIAKQASPVTHVDANDPPSLLVHGTADDLVNIRQARLLHEKLTGAGADCELHEIEGEGHAVRDKAAYERVAMFFDEHLGGYATRVMKNVDLERLGQMRDQRRGDAPRRGQPANPRPANPPNPPAPPAESAPDPAMQPD